MDSLKHLHTFALNASCNQIKTINSIDSLMENVAQLIEDNTTPPFLVLGEGSNTVFIDDYYSTVLLNRIMGIELHEDEVDYYLGVGAGENWHKLVQYCMQNNIGGFENLALIPGTVGAAPIQNIGAYGIEIDRFVDSVEFLDTSTMKITRVAGVDCAFGYRDSIFKHQVINQRLITRVFFKLPKKYTLEASYGPLANLHAPTALQIYECVIHVRKSKLPDVKTLGNAGSFFKNPIIDNIHFDTLINANPTMPHYAVGENHTKIPAAWLIDQLGFKGKQIGDIGCHATQALVLVNLGGGTGQDLLALARRIQNAVSAKFNIRLENEVRLMGRQGLIQL